MKLVGSLTSVIQVALSAKGFRERNQFILCVQRDRELALEAAMRGILTLNNAFG